MGVATSAEGRVCRRVAVGSSEALGLCEAAGTQALLGLLRGSTVWGIQRRFTFLPARE